jgi:hypothetical protein
MVHHVAVAFLVGADSRYEVTMRRDHPVTDHADVEALTCDLRARFGTDRLRILGFHPTLSDLGTDHDTEGM